MLDSEGFSLYEQAYQLSAEAISESAFDSALSAQV